MLSENNHAINDCVRIFPMGVFGIDEVEAEICLSTSILKFAGGRHFINVFVNGERKTKVVDRALLLKVVGKVCAELSNRFFDNSI